MLCVVIIREITADYFSTPATCVSVAVKSNHNHTGAIDISPVLRRIEYCACLCADTLSMSVRLMTRLKVGKVKIFSKSVQKSRLHLFQNRLNSGNNSIPRRATSCKVADLISGGVIGIFYLLNRSARTTAVRSTQPLTEMSSRNGDKGGRYVRLTFLLHLCADFLKIPESLNVLNTYWPVQASTGIALPF
jgi:hypothetical protein